MSRLVSCAPSPPGHRTGTGGDGAGAGFPGRDPRSTRVGTVAASPLARRTAFGSWNIRCVAVSVTLVWLTCCSSAVARKWPWSRADEPAQPPHPAVVRVLVDEPDGISQGSGTLVDIRDHAGLVVTNWHVVRDASGPIHVIFPDGFRSAARLLQVDPDWDLAALMIWRPPTAPVPLATRAPRPGDPLTIAGYGPGRYRAAAGRCTQYVAPSTRHPYEMVEVSAVARQGDSGGPIFNEQGELAGVLFGSGGGTTSGSWAGRVAQFLGTVWPPPASEQPGTAWADLTDPSGMGSDMPPPPATHVEADRYAALTDLTPLPAREPGAPRLEPLQATPRPDLPPDLSPDLSPRDTATAPAPDPLTGDALFEQARNVFALIGLLAVALHCVRWLSPRG
jgi:hypothetical protein